MNFFLSRYGCVCEWVLLFFCFFRFISFAFYRSCSFFFAYCCFELWTPCCVREWVYFFFFVFSSVSRDACIGCIKEKSIKSSPNKAREVFVWLFYPKSSFRRFLFAPVAPDRLSLYTLNDFVTHTVWMFASSYSLLRHFFFFISIPVSISLTLLSLFLSFSTLLFSSLFSFSHVRSYSCSRFLSQF